MSHSISPVATEIARQIGGPAFLMMGTRRKIADGDDLTFDLRGCRKFNRVRVHLTEMDTYTLTFSKVRNFETVREETVSGVYGDTLRAAIAEHTGLTLTVPRVLGINA